MPATLRFQTVLLLSLVVFPGALQAWDVNQSLSSQQSGSNYTVEEYRVALRLQRRIANRFQHQISLENAVLAVHMRHEMLRRIADVRFVDRERGSAMIHAQWLASAGKHPSWIGFSLDEQCAAFHIDEHAIRLSIEAGEPTDFQRPKNAIFRNVHQDRRILRGESVGETQAGYEFDAALLSSRIAKSLRGQTDEVIDSETSFVQPQLFVLAEDGSSKTLTRLSVGRSDFARSPWGRIQNIHQALLGRMNGAVIPVGSVFSFNDALVGASGWKNALVIVNGKDLVNEPGGGICQVSTTVYRSVLLAGLPVTQRKSHSLYVTYYKEFGVGIDATVYFGKQDLQVVNNTPGDVVMLTRIEGTEAIVELYGLPDGRSVDMQGPFFAQTAPEDLLINGRKPRTTEIIWTHAVTYADGRTEDNVIVSQYNSLPRSLHLEYPVSRGIAELEGTYTAQKLELPEMVVLGTEL